MNSVRLFDNFDQEHVDYIAALGKLRQSQADAGLRVDIPDNLSLTEFFETFLAEAKTIPKENRRASTVTNMEVVLRRKANELLGSLNNRDRNRVARIPIGILPQSTIRATVHRDGYIAVSIGFTSALHAICKAVLFLLSMDRSSPSEHVAGEVVVRCLRGLYSRDSLALPKIGMQHLPPHAQQMAMDFLHIQETFVICHEYGHLLCGHLDDSSMNDPTQIVAEEVEADERAYAILEAYLAYSKIDREQGFAALDLMFTALWLADHLDWIGGQTQHFSLADESYEDTGARLFDDFLFQSIKSDIYHVPGIVRRSSLHNWLYERSYLPGLELAREMDQRLRHWVEINVLGKFDRPEVCRATDDYLAELAPTL